MGPEDTSLDQHYEIPDYATTLVNPPPDAAPIKVKRMPSLYQFNRRALLISMATVITIMLIVGLAFGYSLLKDANAKDVTSKEGSYSVGSVSVNGVENDQLKVVTSSETLAVNGQLQVKNTLVLSPSGAPTNPTAGQVYYDKITNTPYYYNGTAFVAIATSISGVSGSLSLGGGLSLVNSTIVNSGVISIQGQSGAVNFASGPGIAINGSTISNSGVLGISANSNQLAITSSGGNTQISIVGIQPGGVLVGTTGNGISTVLPGGPGECLVSDGSNLPAFSSCTGAGGVTSLDAGNGALTSAITIQGSGGISVGSSGNTISIDGSALSLPSNYVATLGTLTGLSVTGNSGQGSTPNLSVLYGATSTTALRGDTTLICPSGTGNLSGGGGTITLANNTSCPNLTIVNSPTFSGTVTASSGVALASGKTLTATGSGIDVSAGNGGSDTITFYTANGANSFILPTTGGLGQTICTTAITCAAGGGQAVILEPGASPQSSAAATAAIFINKTLAATGNLLQLQSNGVDKFVINNKGELNNLSLNGGTAGTDYVTLQGGTQTGAGTLNIPDLNGATRDICLSSGNCAGLGGGITGSGTTNTLAMFTGSGTLGNSLLSQSGTTTTVGGYLAIPASFSGPGTIILGNGGTNGSQIQFKNATNSNTLTLQSGITAGNFSLTLPTADGTGGQCLGTNGSGQLAFQNCLSGSGAGGGVTQFNTKSGAISLLGTTNQVIITESPSGTFTLTTPQDIAISSSPVFGGLTLSSFGAGIVQSSAGGVLSSSAVSRNSATLLSGTLSVANGGTGSTSFNSNGILLGSGSGVVLSTGMTTNGILATDGAGVPDLVNTLPTAVQGNITRTGILANGSIASGFGTIVTGNSLSVVGVNSGSGLLQGSGGLTTTGATSSINASSNFNTNINTGTSTGAVSIGNSLAGTISLQSSGSINLTPGGTGNTGVNIRPGSANSTSVFTIQNAAGNSNLFIADSTNTRIGIGRTSTAYTLEVAGDIYSTSSLIAESGSNISKLQANNLQFNSTGTSHIDQLGVNGNLDITTKNTAASAQLTRLTFGAGDNASVAFTNGQYSFKPGTNTTTAFQVQNAAGSNLFNIDSTNSNITINAANTPTVQAWQTGNNSGFLARESFTSVVANGYIYIIGGINSGTTATNTVQYAKILANGNVGNWSTVANLPAARDHASAVFANGYIYVTGGATNETAATGHNDVYYGKVGSDGNITSWTTSANPIAVGGNQERWRHSSVVANDYLYVIGGQDTTATIRNTVYKSKLNPDGSNGTWSSAGTTLNTAMYSHASAVANGYVYAIGGSSSINVPSNVTQYAKLNADGSIGTWNTTQNLPDTRTDMGIAVINGTIYATGGESSGYHANTFYATLGSAGTIGAWNCQGSAGSCGTATPVNSTALPATRSEFGSVPLTANGYIYVVGGWNGAANNTVYYTSTSRVLVNGSLDLVGTSGQNLNEGNSGGTLTAGNTNIIGTLNVQDTANFVQSVSVGANLNVTGDSLIGGTLTVTGATTLSSTLLVSGVATFSTNIIVNGHIIGGGTSPSAAARSGAGSTGSCSLDTANSATNSDVAGAVTIVPGGTGIAPIDAYCRITFATTYGAPPRVMLTPLNDPPTQIGMYVTTSTTGAYFDINFHTAGGSGTTYTVAYHVIK